MINSESDEIYKSKTMSALYSMETSGFLWLSPWRLIEKEHLSQSKCNLYTGNWECYFIVIGLEQANKSLIYSVVQISITQLVD